MNWTKIKTAYPLAFKNFIEKEAGLIKPGKGLPQAEFKKDLESFLEEYETRMLYDFFDKKGMYVFVTIFNPFCTDPGTVYLTCGIRYRTGLTNHKAGIFSERDKAEADIFKYAFLKLNQRLLNKRGQ